MLELLKLIAVLIEVLLIAYIKSYLIYGVGTPENRLNHLAGYRDFM